MPEQERIIQLKIYEYICPKCGGKMFYTGKYQQTHEYYEFEHKCEKCQETQWPNKCYPSWEDLRSAMEK